jgi:hypothetical protein
LAAAAGSAAFAAAGVSGSAAAFSPEAVSLAAGARLASGSPELAGGTTFS